MKRIILLFICLISITCLYAQDNYPKVAKDICNCIDKVNLQEKSEQRNQKAIQCLQNEYAHQDAALKVDIQKLKKQNPSLSELECSKLLGEKILQYLMKNCVSFQNVSMQDNHTGPETSKAVLIVGEKICDCISKKPLINDVNVDDCVNSELASEENLKIINKEFNINDGTVFTQFGQRLSSYLLSKCDRYIQWTTKEMYKRK